MHALLSVAKNFEFQEVEVSDIETPGSGHRDEAPPVAQWDVSLHQEWLLDEALKETFPASDPISPARPTQSHREGAQQATSTDSETPA